MATAATRLARRSLAPVRLAAAQSTIAKINSNYPEDCHFGLTGNLID